MPKQTILIVDDETMNIKLIKAFLLKEGYHFLTAMDGEEALEIANDTIPDLILLDVMMPGIDGFEVCLRLKEKEGFKDVPIIMVTALMEKENKVKAMEVGADDFICKPLDRTELIVRIKSLLRIKSYHDDLLKSYHEISRKNEKLREMEKVKEGLTNMIIHDLNNYFMAIFSNLELMSLLSKPYDTDLKKNISNCLSNTSEVSELVRGLLDIHKMEEGKLILEKKEINIGTLVKAIIVSLGNIADKKNIYMKFLETSNETRIRGDSSILKRVMTNLLSNAFRHTPNGGKIEIEINPNQQNGSICLSVKDNGNGLAPKYHEKIFEKFEQVNLKKEGVSCGTSGLGLSFCKLAVEAHQGKIWVESEGKDQGCTFKVTLPV